MCRDLELTVWQGLLKINKNEPNFQLTQGGCEPFKAETVVHPAENLHQDEREGIGEVIASGTGMSGPDPLTTKAITGERLSGTITMKSSDRIFIKNNTNETHIYKK